MREKVTQIQEAERCQIKRNPKRPTPRHIIIKIAKFQDKENLKGGKRQIGSNIQVSPIRLAADFSTETLQARRE